jgi:alpha-galactosidase
LLAFDSQRDEPLTAMVHDTWGGAMWELDTTDPAALAHLEHTALSLRDMGYSYLKLDFTFSPTFPGRYRDPTKTPAERVRAGYEAIRRGAGDDAFILACGCPLGSVVGVVDAMRIGPDVSPSWEWAPHDTLWPGYEATAPSTRNAWNSTLLRAFMHRRLWLNDPDCLMLRQRETAMSPNEVRAWALAIGQSGGLALVSDDLALLDAEAHALLSEVIDIGRAVDAESCAGTLPRCDDFLSPAGPTTLTAAGRRLRADPADPVPTLESQS